MTAAPETTPVFDRLENERLTRLRSDLDALDADRLRMSEELLSVSEENGRLRAELAEARELIGGLTADLDLYIYQSTKFHTTITRVRAVLELGDTDHIEDDPPGEHDDAYNAGMDYVVDALRAALDGEQ